jgi:hypothetical protein
MTWEDRFAVVLDGRKWIVKVMEKLSPLRIAVGLSKADGVIFEGAPGDEKQVTVWRLDAAVDVDGAEPGCGCDERRCCCHGFFECPLFARDDVKDGDF